MLGTRFNKPLTDLDAYSQAAEWCNVNGAHIEDNGEYYEVVETIVQEPTHEEIKASRIAELKQKLAETDYIVLKIAEGSATKKEYSEKIAQRQEWRTEINDIESELENVERD
jgi:hypothetical protein